MTTTPDMPTPTAQVAVFVDVLGAEKAVDFLLQFGGADMDYSPNPRGSSELVKAIGKQKAVELGRKMNFTRRRVPTAKPWIAQALAAKGLSNVKISRRLLTTDVTIRKWLNAARSDWAPNPAQLPLFPEDT